MTSGANWSEQSDITCLESRGAANFVSAQIAGVATTIGLCVCIGDTLFVDRLAVFVLLYSRGNKHLCLR